MNELRDVAVQEVKLKLNLPLPVYSDYSRKRLSSTIKDSLTKKEAEYSALAIA